MVSPAPEFTCERSEAPFRVRGHSGSCAGALKPMLMHSWSGLSLAVTPKKDPDPAHATSYNDTRAHAYALQQRSVLVTLATVTTPEMLRTRVVSPRSLRFSFYSPSIYLQGSCENRWFYRASAASFSIKCLPELARPLHALHDNRSFRAPTAVLVSGKSHGGGGSGPPD
ncbi:hypothetical protein EYF80_015057 [Liparis tanakae]|uniref:Uncharacterized protein n=1 Tax=Liparis tanakae TaxID=230148 RepID=A0A4Z2I9H8_9TELE|nr:hypothetical protein EYF80_015057 [Liparis tanakae]